MNTVRAAPVRAMPPATEAVELEILLPENEVAA
jgi:hypothetical protein